MCACQLLCALCVWQPKAVQTHIKAGKSLKPQCDEQIAQGKLKNVREEVTKYTKALKGLRTSAADISNIIEFNVCRGDNHMTSLV